MDRKKAFFTIVLIIIIAIIFSYRFFPSKDQSFIQIKRDISSLNMDAKTNNIYIKQQDDTFIQNEKEKIDISDNKVYRVDAKENSNIIISIDKSIKELKIATLTGKIYLDNIQLERLLLQSQSGDIELNHSSSRDVIIKANDADITITASTFDSMQIEANLSNLQAFNIESESSVINLAAGSISLDSSSTSLNVKTSQADIDLCLSRERSISTKSESGSIIIDSKYYKPGDDYSLETKSGSISIRDE